MILKQTLNIKEFDKLIKNNFYNDSQVCRYLNPNKGYIINILLMGWLLQHVWQFIKWIDHVSKSIDHVRPWVKIDWPFVKLIDHVWPCVYTIDHVSISIHHVSISTDLVLKSIEQFDQASKSTSYLKVC